MNHITSNSDKKNFKKKLLLQCVTLIEQRIATSAKNMEDAQAAANFEEKSSSGDKYETSRAMSHLEKDMHSRQFADNRNELTALLRIEYSGMHDSVVTGSLVFCGDCAFFIAAGLGKILFEGMHVFLLSPHAPAAKLLFNKKVGDTFIFNKKEMLINAII